MVFAALRRKTNRRSRRFVYRPCCRAIAICVNIYYLELVCGRRGSRRTSLRDRVQSSARSAYENLKTWRARDDRSTRLADVNATYGRRNPEWFSLLKNYVPRAVTHCNRKDYLRPSTHFLSILCKSGLVNLRYPGYLGIQVAIRLFRLLRCAKWKFDLYLYSDIYIHMYLYIYTYFSRFFSIIALASK